MPQFRRPRRGSLAFYPRKRARRIYPSISTYPDVDKPKVLALAGYKVGMTHAILQDNKKGSSTFGQEISVPVTILECPPIKVIGIRTYRNTDKGLVVLTETFSKNLPKELSRKINVGKADTEKKISEMEKNVEKISRVRLVVSTQPWQSGVKKKTPEIFEIEIGGKDAKEKLEYAKQMIEKEIFPNDVVKEGELVDVISVTKGKGTVGPVGRFGVKILDHHSKQKRRHVGAIAQQVPRRVRWTAPMAGQMGFQTRTELNKRVLKIGDGKEVIPAGGFKRYGILKNNYLVLQGSVPGPKKRLVLLRAAIRPQKVKLLVPEVREIAK